MTLDEFNRLRAELNEKCENLLDCKGQDYTDGIDRLYNFKEIAKELGLTPLQVWAIYFWKHYKSVMNYCKTGSIQSEEIGGRFQDLRNYVDLGYALLKEAEAPKSPTFTMKKLGDRIELEVEKTRSGYSLKSDSGMTGGQP